MKNVLTMLASAWLLASCVPTTPQSRIAESPRQYAALSTKHQVLVQQGQLARGMSPDAVYLAWGRPSSTFQGSRNGQLSERWDYVGSAPVAVTSFYGGYGYGGFGGRGYHGHHGYSSIGMGFGPELAYVPYRIGSVLFIDHRVDSWERAK